MRETSAIRKPYKQDADRGTVQVKFNLTPKQAEQLSSKVEQSNLTASAFIRQKLGIR
jgi:uncharacterized protein YicC (UPF0701 family)